MCLPYLLTEDKLGVVSQSQDEEEALEEPSTYQEEVADEQPGEMLLEKTDYLREPQAMGFQEAQTPEALNGGSHQGEHSPSQKGVCAFEYSLIEGTVCVSNVIWEYVSANVLPVTYLACNSCAL